MAFWVALISGACALIGALGSQLVNALFGLKSKKLELLYKNKADTYRCLMEMAGEFALNPKNQEKYLRFLSAYEIALIFASDKVAEVLTGRTGLNVSAQRLRTAQDKYEMEGVQVKEWHDAVTALTQAMRDDLKHLSK